jgi:hypothetical protein
MSVLYTYTYIKYHAKLKLLNVLVVQFILISPKYQ